MTNDEFDPESRERLPLFKKPFYSDWTIILGAVAVGVGAWSSASGYPPIWQSTSGDLVAVSIDVGLGGLFQVIVFSFVPAAIRRRWGKGWAALNPPREKESRVWMVALVVAVAAVLAAGSSSTQEPSSAAAVPECRSRDGDLICFTVTSANDDGATVAAEWIYAVPRSLGSTSISKWTWGMTVSCNTRTGIVYGVAAFDLSGARLALTEATYDQVRSGMQRDQIPALVSDFC